MVFQDKGSLPAGQDEHARERGYGPDINPDEDVFQRQPIETRRVHFPHQHPIDEEVSSSSKDNMLDPHDLNALRLQLAEQDAIYERLREERETNKMNALIERESLLRKIKEMKEP